MLRLAQERDSLNIIDDQIGAPTGADLLADVTAHAVRTALQRPEVSGLYHLVAGGEVSWHGYARFVIDFAARSGIDIKVAAGCDQAGTHQRFPHARQTPAQFADGYDKTEKNIWSVSAVLADRRGTHVEGSAGEDVGAGHARSYR